MTSPRVRINLVHADKNTKIINAEEIATVLNISPYFIVRYIAQDLFTRVTSRDSFALEGVYDEKKIQRKVDKFVSLFATCEDCCSRAEITLMNDDAVLKSCAKCGNLNTIRRKSIWIVVKK